MKKAYVIPTGDEILNGTVKDIDTPEIMRQLIAAFPEVEVTRLSPLVDDEGNILGRVDEIAKSNPDLIIMVGGSGGGHRFSSTLGKDYTHSALEKYLDSKSSCEIYGKNGHLWSKLICGYKENAMIINVPGPFSEAKAAFSAFVEQFAAGGGLKEINKAMADAVFAQYPTGKDNG